MSQRDGSYILRPALAPLRWWIRRRNGLAYQLGYYDGWTDGGGRR
jgi:hypothetical protein